MLLRTICLVSCLALTLVGCSSESDEADHVHHSLPAHKPANLEDAIASLSSRAHMLAHHGGERQSSEFLEFIDVVNWIPELAADSDLDKSDWEAANAAASRMAIRVQSDVVQLADLEGEISNDLNLLQELLPRAGTPEPDLFHHGHGYGHGHHHDHGDGTHSH